MKKRVLRYSCDACQLHFETWERYTIHSGSRAHLVQSLQTPAYDVQLDEVEHQNISEAEWLDRPFYDVAEQEDACLSEDEFTRDSESDMETDEFYVFHDQNDEQYEYRRGAYFPFPSEIFFLLYSYAHNISRPKVMTDYTLLL